MDAKDPNIFFLNHFFRYAVFIKSEGICCTIYVFPTQMVAAVDEIKERHVVATDFGKKILNVQQVLLAAVCT
jgi:hypothetical protein